MLETSLMGCYNPAHSLFEEQRVAVSFVAESRLPTPYGEFIMYGFEEGGTGKEHLALTMGDVSDGEPVLARVHLRMSYRRCPVQYAL